MSKSSIDAGLHAGFIDPNPEFSPVPIWWWSGDALNLDRMIWQVDQLVAQGVHNAVVLNLAPTGPLYGALSDAPHMLTEDWWQIWEGLCDHGQKVGMRLWFYDQIGFSGANLQGRLALETPAFVGMELQRIVLDATGEGELALPEAGVFISGQAVPLDAEGRVIGPAVDLPLSAGRVVWTGDGRARLILAYALRKGFDYHSPAACAALIDLVHGSFERRLGRFFGTAIVGSFQDELPSMPTWSPRFAEEFAARCGYDLPPVIAALWEDWGIDSARVRIDYQRVRAALAEEAFFRPVFDWHDSRGLTFGVDQQSPSRAAQPISTVHQYADYARTHRWYSAPGSDHWGEAKFHSSIAHSYGRPRTWIEAFHSSGWGGTLEETFDWLQPWLLAGANLYDPHAVYYSTKGGQWEWAAPSTCWRQPYWRHYKQFADAVSRLCWAATRGEHVCDVGVLFPSATVQADFFGTGYGAHAARAHEAYQALVGQMTWFNARPGVLKRMRRDFDVLDDDTIAAATVRDGALVTRGESYRAILVPDCWMLESATAARLVTFARAGGRLVLIGDPPRVADRPEGKAAIDDLLDLVARNQVTRVSSTDMEPGLRLALDGIVPPAITASPSLLRQVGRTNLLFLTAATAGSVTPDAMLPWAEWDFDRDLFSWSRYNVELREQGIGFDLSAQRHSAEVRLRGPVALAEQWDPATGRARPVPLRRIPGGTVATVDFTDAPMAVLVWSEDPAAQPVLPASATFSAAASGERRSLGTVWESRLIPTMDNRHGDFSLPATPGPLPVQAWQVGHRLDSATLPDPGWGADGWADVPVTDGLRGWFLRQEAGAEPAQPLPPGHKGPLQDTGWTGFGYSLSRGIRHDAALDGILGPKGRVLEPLFRLPDAAPGEVVSLRIALPVAEAGPITLAIGGNADRLVWWNGAPVPGGADDSAYQTLHPVVALAGINILELRMTVSSASGLEAYWALTSDAAAFVRPEWITPGQDLQAGTTLVLRRDLTLAPGERVEAHFGTIGVAHILVNGKEVGIQGAFDPYPQWRNARVLRYDLTPLVMAGENRIEVRFVDDGGAIGLFVDALITALDGGARSLVSDLTWTALRESLPVRLVHDRERRNDTRFYQLRPRPHPLPRTGWLDPEQPLAGVLDIVPDPHPFEPRPVQWFRLPLPPGATRVTLPLSDARIAAFVEGREVAVRDGMIDLAGCDAIGAVLLLRVEVLDGRRGGAVWDGPASFETGAGRIALGSWMGQGLAFYSGGVEYRTTFQIDRPDQWHSIDLGRVRGTAEVEVNGQSLGVRVWSPYAVDLGESLRPGRNEVVIRVFNTLAPYLRGASATQSIFAGQEESGLFGPVTLRGA